jgi:hypothetical protein
MNDLKQLNTLISQVYNISKKISNSSNFETLADTNSDLQNKINILEEKLVNKDNELEDFKKKYDNDMKIKNNELKEKCEELNNLTKVSFVQSLNKQINDKNLIIQQLENQISKLKTYQTKETTIDNKKPKKEINIEFNVDNFEDVNGFELTLYKKNYYLRDLETNELYDIYNNKPGKIVGLLNSKGKIQFN